MEQQKKILSIVIPVYKVEKYLNKCLDSILTALKDREEEYEVILVNDGSPDGCGAICDEYKSKHENFIVIHKENEGVSMARNDGVHASTGEYVAFIDSDDYVTHDLANFLDEIKQLAQSNFENANNDECVLVDLINVGFTGITEDGKVLRGATIKPNQSDELIPHRFPAPWCKIVRRDFLMKNDLFFLKGLKIGEDLEWSSRVWLAAQKTYSSTQKYYMYLEQRVGNAMGSYNLNKFCAVIDFVKNNYKLVNNSTVDIKTKKQIKRILTTAIYRGIYASGKHFNKSDRKEVVKILRQHKFLLKRPKTLSANLFRFSTFFIGIGNSLRLLAFTSRNRT